MLGGTARTFSRILGAALTAGLHVCPVIAERNVSRIDVQIGVPPAVEARGVRVWLSGGSQRDNEHRNETAKLDANGRATLWTRRTGDHFVVARSAQCDITLGGTRSRLSVGGPYQLFQRGRLSIPAVGSQVAPDFLFPFTGIDAPVQQAPAQVLMTRKRPGYARFIFVVEDAVDLTESLNPDHSPQPAGKVFVTGDWNGFTSVTEDVDPVNGAKEMFDDGSFFEPDGDQQLGDGVFSRVLKLPPGDHAYAFLVNGGTHPFRPFTRDPYEERHITRTGPVTTMNWCTQTTYPGTATMEVSTIRVTAP